MADGRITDVAVPDDAVVSIEIGIVGYVDQDGDMAYGIRTRGDAPVSSYLGLLTLAEHTLITEVTNGE